MGPTMPYRAAYETSRVGSAARIVAARARKKPSASGLWVLHSLPTL